MSEEAADGQTSELPAEKKRTFWQDWWVLILLIAIGASIGIGVKIADIRAEDRMVDEFYCTLEGSGAWTRAPRSGDRCVDVWNR